jgi:hypothetical protein
MEVTNTCARFLPHQVLHVARIRADDRQDGSCGVRGLLHGIAVQGWWAGQGTTARLALRLQRGYAPVLRRSDDAL